MPLPTYCSRRAGGGTSSVSSASSAATASGDSVQVQVGAERAGDLRDAQDRAEVARGERGGRLGDRRLDVGAGRPDRRDLDGLGARRLRAREHLARVALRAAVAEQEQRVAGLGSGPVDRRLVGLHRPRLDARVAQQGGAVIDGVPARAGAAEQDAPARDALGGALGRPRVAQHPPEVFRLPPHRLAHHAHVGSSRGFGGQPTGVPQQHLPGEVVDCMRADRKRVRRGSDAGRGLRADARSRARGDVHPGRRGHGQERRRLLRRAGHGQARAGQDDLQGHRSRSSRAIPRRAPRACSRRAPRRVARAPRRRR